MIIFYFLLIVFLVLRRPFQLVSYSFTQTCQLVFSLDLNSLLFSKILIIISIAVLLWSYYYLGSEPVYIRFFYLILRFLFSMFILIFATSLLGLLIGWDLLGFTSFFLVAFYGNQSSHAAAILTGLTNRVGDCFFFLLLAICFTGGYSLTWASFVLILLIGITKSAQLPFSAWLPAAMFAPTPVRALVHSSTLVTAGVYLLYRYRPLHSETLLWIGVLTSLFGGLAACTESDIKKVIAYSTLSQLGILMSGLGIGLRRLTFNHLLSHAVIKALIFMRIGTLMHSYYGSQEARSCSRLPYSSGFTTVILGLSALGLAGITFSTGYYSKEPLLEAGYLRGLSLFSLVTLYLSISVTLGYLLRLGIVLGSSEVSCTVSVARVGSRPILLVSMGILLVTMFFQALSFRCEGPLTSVWVSALDKLLLYPAMFCGGVLGYYSTFSTGFCPLPNFYLNARVQGYGVCSLSLSKSMFTEVACVQAFSGGRTQDLISKLSSTTILSSKLLLCLIFIFCIS